MSQIFTLSRPDLLATKHEMLVRASISLTFLFMNKPASRPDAPEQHTLFRLGADGHMKTRQVWEPSEETRIRHEGMLARLYELDIPMPYAYGGLPGKSLRDNVEPHQQSDAFYMLDIKNAYGSVDIDYLREQAAKSVPVGIGNSRLRQRLDDFIVNDAVIDEVPGLPLGYPCSPFLFNLYCRGMDGRLAYAVSHLPWEYRSRVKYTRWLDDLTFSAPTRDLTPHKRRAIREIISETPGFEIESRKTRFHKLGNGAVTITGVSLYPDRRMTPSPGLLDKTAKLFADVQKRLESGEELSEQEMSEVNGFNSILHMTGKPEHTGSRLVRALSVQYQDIARRSLGMK